jgi:hypothetical protein
MWWKNKHISFFSLDFHNIMGYFAVLHSRISKVRRKMVKFYSTWNRCGNLIGLPASQPASQPKKNSA